MGKLTDNMESVRLSCPTLSQPLTLCSVNNNIADLGSTVPVCSLGHEPLLFNFSISVVFEDSLLLLLLLPRKNKHICSPHSSSNLLSGSQVVPHLPWVQ